MAEKDINFNRIRIKSTNPRFDVTLSYYINEDITTISINLVNLLTEQNDHPKQELVKLLDDIEKLGSDVQTEYEADKDTSPDAVSSYGIATGRLFTLKRIITMIIDKLTKAEKSDTLTIDQEKKVEKAKKDSETGYIG